MKIEITVTHGDETVQTMSSTDCENYDGIKTMLRALVVLIGCDGIVIQE